MPPHHPDIIIIIMIYCYWQRLFVVAFVCQCVTCGQTFAHLYQLDRHRRTQHPHTHSAERRFSCPECGMTFSRQEHVRRHAMVHSAVKPHVCAECGKSFTWKELLQRHFQIHERETELRQFFAQDWLVSVFIRDVSSAQYLVARWLTGRASD